MKRRTLLAAAAGFGAVLAGCTSADSDEEATAQESDAEDEGDNAEEDGNSDEEPTDAELVDGFQFGLEERGFEGVVVDPVDDGLGLGYDATGGSEDDVAAEIELITDEYTTAIDGGLSVARLEATAYEPGGNAVVDYFTVETEWVEAYLSEELEWSELLTRIGETFVSAESTDDGDDGAEGESETDDEPEDDGTDGDDTNETDDDSGDGEPEPEPDEQG